MFGKSNYFSGPIAQLDTCLPAGREQPTNKAVLTMFVYVIRSEVDGRFYVGMTENLERRLNEHNSGKTKSTKGYRPWILVHSEVHPDRITARKREKYLKSGVGKEYIKLLWSHSSIGYLPAGRQGATDQ
jgi:putative endonuclease